MAIWKMTILKILNSKVKMAINGAKSSSIECKTVQKSLILNAVVYFYSRLIYFHQSIDFLYTVLLPTELFLLAVSNFSGVYLIENSDYRDDNFLFLKGSYCWFFENVIEISLHIMNKPVDKKRLNIVKNNSCLFPRMLQWGEYHRAAVTQLRQNT